MPDGITHVTHSNSVTTTHVVSHTSTHVTHCRTLPWSQGVIYSHITHSVCHTLFLHTQTCYTSHIFTWGVTHCHTLIHHAVMRGHKHHHNCNMYSHTLKWCHSHTTLLDTCSVILSLTVAHSHLTHHTCHTLSLHIDTVSPQGHTGTASMPHSLTLYTVLHTEGTWCYPQLCSPLGLPSHTGSHRHRFAVMRVIFTHSHCLPSLSRPSRFDLALGCSVSPRWVPGPEEGGVREEWACPFLARPLRGGAVGPSP